MARKTFDLDDCVAPIEVEQWAAVQERPLHDEIEALDAGIAAANQRKRELHQQIDEIERQSAARRYELRGDDAGPDQLLVPDGALSDDEIERLRRVIAQHDSKHA